VAPELQAALAELTYIYRGIWHGSFSLSLSLFLHLCLLICLMNQKLPSIYPISGASLYKLTEKCGPNLRANRYKISLHKSTNTILVLSGGSWVHVVAHTRQTTSSNTLVSDPFRHSPFRSGDLHTP